METAAHPFTQRLVAQIEHGGNVAAVTGTARIVGNLKPVTVLACPVHGQREAEGAGLVVVIEGAFRHHRAGGLVDEFHLAGGCIVQRDSQIRGQ